MESIINELTKCRNIYENDSEYLKFQKRLKYDEYDYLIEENDRNDEYNLEELLKNFANKKRKGYYEKILAPVIFLGNLDLILDNWFYFNIDWPIFFGKTITLDALILLFVGMLDLIYSERLLNRFSYKKHLEAEIEKM